MSRSIDLRCSAPHPEVSGWSCRAKLNVTIPSAFELQVLERAPAAAQHIRVTCWRCGSVLVIRASPEALER